MKGYRKDDVEFHSDGYREAHAAVNVKVYDAPTAETVRTVLRDAGLTTRQDPDAILDAMREMEEGGDYSAWESAITSGWEWLDMIAAEDFGPGHGVAAEGRSGGWCVVTYNGRPTFDEDDVAGWDAIALSKWARFERCARDSAADVPYKMVDFYVHNVLTPEADVEGLALAGVGL